MKLYLNSAQRVNATWPREPFESMQLLFAVNRGCVSGNIRTGNSKSFASWKKKKKRKEMHFHSYWFQTQSFSKEENSAFKHNLWLFPEEYRGRRGAGTAIVSASAIIRLSPLNLVEMEGLSGAFSVNKHKLCWGTSFRKFSTVKTHLFIGSLQAASIF